MKIASAAIVGIAAFHAAIGSPAAQGIACRLSVADCMVVEAEDAAAKRYARRASWAAVGLTPHQRGILAIRIERRYVEDRVKRLPPHIGNEWERLIVCRADFDAGMAGRSRLCR